MHKLIQSPISQPSSKLQPTMSSIVLAAPIESTLSMQGKQIVPIKIKNGDGTAEVSAVSLQVPEENQYTVELERALFQKNELIIDFSSLKTCLDPLGEPAETSSSDEEFNYKSFIYEIFDNKCDQFSSLQRLVLRKVPMANQLGDNESPLSIRQWNRYTHLYHGILQLPSLTELDLSDNGIDIELQTQLQFWGLENLKKLVMDNTGLKTFPASVGRLRKLEELSLSNNKLCDLPVTLRFCKNLRVLNLTKNQFKQIPAVVLHLEKLEYLKRLGNPLTTRDMMAGPRYTRAIGKPFSNNNSSDGTTTSTVKYNPQSLQTLCTQTIFSTQVDYWKQLSIGPLQCKTLDRLAGTFSLCENCQRVITNVEVGGVEVLLLTFVELSGVNFRLNTCSQECQTKTVEKYSEKNIQLQKELDEKYEREIREAEQFVARNVVDISPETINAPSNLVENFVARYPRGRPYVRQNFNRRQRWKCAIM